MARSRKACKVPSSTFLPTISEVILVSMFTRAALPVRLSPRSILSSPTSSRPAERSLASFGTHHGDRGRLSKRRSSKRFSQELTALGAVAIVRDLMLLVRI